MTEEVNLEKQVVKVDELKLASWAFYRKESKTKDCPS